MNRLFKLQFLGPVALFVGTGCAELAARALQYNPTSEFLWFLNLRVFGIFQRSHATLSWFISIDGFQFFAIALPIFLLACVGLLTRTRIPFTVATHLSALYAAFLVSAWQTGVPVNKQASLVPIAVPTGPDLYVMLTILVACFLSFAVTHVLYLRIVRKEVGAAANWLKSMRSRRSSLASA
jgi:hypothetical protein